MLAVLLVVLVPPPVELVVPVELVPPVPPPVVVGGAMHVPLLHVSPAGQGFSTHSPATHSRWLVVEWHMLSMSPFVQLPHPLAALQLTPFAQALVLKLPVALQVVRWPTPIESSVHVGG